AGGCPGLVSPRPAFPRRTHIMADIVSELAGKAGVTPDQAKVGLGAVLSFLKGHLPEESYSKVQSAVPGADGMIAAAADKGRAGGGLLSAVGDLAGKVFGSKVDGTAALVAAATRMGFSAEQAQAFIPAAPG